MKKLWAAVLTGLLGCSAVGWAAEPVAPGTLIPFPPALQTTNTPTSPYAQAPAAPPTDATPATGKAKAVKKKTTFATPTDPKKAGLKPLSTDPQTPAVLKPAATKWGDSKTVAVQATTVTMDVKTGELKPIPVHAPDLKILAPVAGCGVCAPACGGCTACPKPCAVATNCTPCPKPCEVVTKCNPCPKPCAPVAMPAPCAKACATCNTGCSLCGGHLRTWLTYRPARTPLGECAGDYRIPPVYTFFLDVRCCPNWKPVACCDQPAGTCNPCCHKSACKPACDAVVPMPQPLPEPIPAPLPVLPGTKTTTDR